MVGFRKRTFATAFKKKSRGVTKRRKFNVRRRGSKSTSFSTLSTRANVFGFRNKKVNPRSWRRMLWNNTLQRAHYRSVSTSLQSNTTPATAALARSTVYQALDNGTARFWVTSGGALTNDGTTVPLFDGDIVLRGGISSLSISNIDVSSDTLYADIYFVQAGRRPDTSAFNSATRPAGWDPSMYPEFKQKIGRIISRKTFMIKPGDMMTCTNKVSIQKIDHQGWTTLEDRRYYWLVVTRNPMADSTTTYNIVISWNVSFSADATGTT